MSLSSSFRLSPHLRYFTSTMPVTFFVITLTLLLQPISTGSHHGATQRHYQKRLEEVFHRFSPLVTSHATLNHGANCISPYEEQLRQQIVEELHLIANNHATLGRVKDTIKKMEEFISINGKELCNYKLTLVCDPELRQCVCGPSRTNVTFVWQNGHCRYAEGSMCSAHSKIDCQAGATCISMQTLEECRSGLCFCQREFYNLFETTTVEPTLHSVHRGGAVPPTKESDGETSSSEEDDDDGDGEAERIIVVKVSQVENPVTNEPSYHHHQDTVPKEQTIGTTVPAPIGTSPVPTRRQELTSAIKRLEKEVETVQSLHFGDECSSIGEESNYAEYIRLVSDMNCVTVDNDEDKLMEILGKLESILEQGNMMCNVTLHLQCNSQSKMCECRTSSEDLDGYYLLFMEEKKRCVLVENSRCLSRDYLESKKASVVDIPCVSEAKCIAEETKQECKSKIESCFCRKTPKPTEASKQKKNKSKSKTSSSTSSLFRQFYFHWTLFIWQFVCKGMQTLAWV